MEDNSQVEDSFIRNFTACQAKLRGLVLGLSPTRSDADDVLQEVNLALWRKRHTYDPNRDFLNWACGFALREVRSFRKKSARDRLWFNDSAIECLAESWEPSKQNEGDRRDALSLCLEKLGPDERQCISQYYGEQLTGPEIAKTSDRPVSTVYKVLTRARQALRTCVKRTMSQTSRGF